MNFCLEKNHFTKRQRHDFRLFDPMSGSGTSADVANQMKLDNVVYDLNPAPRMGKGGFDALKDEVDVSSDCIFFHPSYADIIKYSGNMWGKAHPDDLSRCGSYTEFIDKLKFILEKLMISLRKGGTLAVLVGDIRKNGVVMVLL